jgi:hypothetical protein
MSALKLTRGSIRPVPGACPECDGQTMARTVWYVLTSVSVIPRLATLACTRCSVLARAGRAEM